MTPSPPLDKRLVFRGRIFRVSVDRVRLPHGPEVEMDVVRHPGSVVLLPMVDEQHVILVKQYRYAIDRAIWELPAGSLGVGEDPVEAAARECEEEVELVPGRIERLASFYPTPGYCDEEMTFFRLTELAPPGATRRAADLDESFERRVFKVAEARDLVSRGEIVDLKTAVGLMLITSKER